VTDLVLFGGGAPPLGLTVRWQTWRSDRDSNSRALAEECLHRTERYLREARNAYAEGDFPTAIRRNQESVELSVKAALRLLGIEYPRKHDVSDVLDQ
jgi:hypothetical protein